MSTLRIDFAKYGQPVLAALAMVQAMTGVGGEEAADGVKAIEAILETLTDGIAGGATPDAILADLGKLEAGTEQDDLKADTELAARFPTTSTGGGQ